MGTQVVKKGANRAAHDAKTSRAAQRTPLPAKGSRGVGNPTAEVGREMVAERKAATTDAVPSRCVDCNKVVPSTEDRCVSCKTKRQAARKDAAGTGRRTIAQDVAQFGSKVVHMRDLQHMSWLKIAQALGREGNLTTISIWARKLYDGAIAAGIAQPAAETIRVAKRGVTEGVVKHGAAVQLPWVAEDLDDEAIPSLIAGRRIVWKNSISGSPEEAIILRSTPKLAERKDPATGTFSKVTVGHTPGPEISYNEDGRCILNFLARDGGFRAVYVDAILQVS